MIEMPRNKFKAGLREGDTQFGLWLGIPDATVAEIIACTDFDWVVIDNEHGPHNLQDIIACLRAIAPYRSAPIVRPVNDDPALLKKLCDIGVQSFLVPMIDTAEQAAAVVRSIKYPPAGGRGLGTSMARAARWNMVDNYIGSADDEMCVVVQVETVQGMRNVEAIAAVDGVDAIFIGPSDLAASMGHIGQLDHPHVVDAVRCGIQAARSANKFAGLLCLDETSVGHYVDYGANFVGVGVDTLLLGNAARTLINKYRQSKSGDPSASSQY